MSTDNEEDSNLSLGERLRQRKRALMFEDAFDEIEIKRDLAYRINKKKEMREYQSLMSILEEQTSKLEAIYPEFDEEDIFNTVGILYENNKEVSDDVKEAVVDKINTRLNQILDEKVDLENVEEIDFQEFTNKVISDVVGFSSEYFIPLQVFAVTQIYRFLKGDEFKDMMTQEFMSLDDDEETVDFRVKHRKPTKRQEEMNNLIQRLNTGKSNKQYGIIARDHAERKRKKEEERRQAHDISKKFVDCLKKGLKDDKKTQEKDIEKNYPELGKMIVNILNGVPDAEEAIEELSEEQKVAKGFEILKELSTRTKKEKKIDKIVELLRDEYKYAEDSDIERLYPEIGKELISVLGKGDEETPQLDEEIEEIEEKDLTERGLEILKNMESKRKTKRQVNETSDNIIKCLKANFKEKDEKEELDEKVKDNYKELGFLIKDLFKEKKEEDVKEIGKDLINAIQKKVNKSDEDRSPNEWLSVLEDEIQKYVKDFLIANSAHHEIMFKVAKIIMYRHIDRALRTYLERELFRLRACEKEVPFYLDDAFSETQDPVYITQCDYVPFLGYGGLQSYGCDGYGNSGIPTNIRTNDIIGTRL